MDVKDVILLIINRIGVILIVVNIFLPPDAQNPHVWGDAALCVVGGLLWAWGDVLLHLDRGGSNG